MNPQGPHMEPPPLPPDSGIVGYCRACGKALDQASIRTAGGTIYCQEHVPMDASESATESPYAGRYPYMSPAPHVANPDVSPPVAFILGWIPGVGAIYNGQYVKGLIHVVIIGLIISLLSNNSVAGFEPLVSLLLAAFWIYMPFEAYHTAKFRRSGQPVDEVSGLIQVSGNESRFPAAPVILIVLGILLLLDNLGLLELRRALRYWPVLLIAVGVYLLYLRTASASRRASSEEKR